MKKVSLRLEMILLNTLMLIYETNNISEAVTKAIVDVGPDGKSKKKLKTLFSYIGKKPPRIAREVVEAFRQSGCKMFVDLFYGSLAILCYLPEETKVVVNGQLSTKQSYDEIGNLASETHGNRTETVYSYDLLVKCFISL